MCIFGSSGHVVSILGSSGIGRVLPGEELGKVAAICRFLSQLSCTSVRRLVLGLLCLLKVVFFSISCVPVLYCHYTL